MEDMRRWKEEKEIQEGEEGGGGTRED